LDQQEAILITPGQIEEWIREIEERPESAAPIIREISKRLSDLTNKNEQLKDENIALQSGKKVEAYENRIASLEYQLEMIKRQMGDYSEQSEESEGVCLILYDTQGHIIRLVLDMAEVVSGDAVLTSLNHISSVDEAPRFLVTDIMEELLVVFDSGRAVTMPVVDVPLLPGNTLNWDIEIVQEPRGGELLVTILPIAKMALSEYCIQVSRRGYVKKIRETFLETYINNGSIGTGVISPLDKTFALLLCRETHRIVITSREGSIVTLAIPMLPHTIQEAFRLNPGDYVVSAHALLDQPSFIAITQNGKIFHREIDWLELDETGKPLSRSILSKARREAGMRICAAAVVDDDEWVVMLTSDGRFAVYQIGSIQDIGTIVPADSDLEVFGFALFHQ
jgi:DNA gyrase/topoisomerase IV subunit A